MRLFCRGKDEDLEISSVCSAHCRVSFSDMLYHFFHGQSERGFRENGSENETSLTKHTYAFDSES